MTRAIDPLIEEPIQVSSRRPFDRFLEVGRNDVRAAVCARVVADGLPEDRIAEKAAQHVQDYAALFVEVTVKEVDLRVVNVANDGPSIATAGFAEVAVDLVEQRVPIVVEAFVVLVPDELEEGREALVQPAVRPVAAREEIAEPLMSELVGDEEFAVLVEARPFVVEEGICEGRRAHVLH